MFFSSLCCGLLNQTPKQTLEAYKKIPKQELKNYFAYKNRIQQNPTLRKVKILPQLHYQLQSFKKHKPQEVFESTQKNFKSLMQQKSPHVIKKVLKSNYDELIRSYNKSNSKFTDPDFKPIKQTIGVTFARDNHKWKRLSEIIPDLQFVSERISLEDILQGGIGDCYFASAISALADHDFRIKNIFPNLEINPHGIYMARVYYHGIYQEVVVDDYIPVDQANEPIFARPAGGKEIWAMILEKCWAKLFGSYQAIAGGFPDEVLNAFTGAPTFYRSLRQQDQQTQVALFEHIIEAANQGAILCCGTIKAQNDPTILKTGLIEKHAYSLLNIYEKPQKMVKLRNPWGSTEWNGKASSKDKDFWDNMDPIDVEKLGHNLTDDGIFFMLWNDFVRYFRMVDICWINDNANYYSEQKEYKSDVPKLWEFQTSGGEVGVTFSQQNKRGISQKRCYGFVTLIVAKKIGQEPNASYKYIDSISGYRFADFSMRLKHLDKGKYIVYASVQWPQFKAQLGTVSLYTDSSISFKENTKIDVHDFLSKVYLNEAENNPQHCDKDSRNTFWESYGLLHKKCRFGYVACSVNQWSKDKIHISVDEKHYQECGMELLPPYKRKGNFTLICEPGQSKIVLYREDIVYDASITAWTSKTKNIQQPDPGLMIQRLKQ